MRLRCSRVKKNIIVMIILMARPMAESSKYGETGEVNMLAIRLRIRMKLKELINGGIVVSDCVAKTYGS